MVISSAGNVGIGTTDPEYKLDVSGGNVRISGNLGVLTNPSDAALISASTTYSTADGNRYGILANHTISDQTLTASREYYGTYTYAISNVKSVGSYNQYVNGLVALARYNGTSTALNSSYIRAIHGSAQNYNIGTVPAAYGISGLVQNNSTGTITNAYAGFFDTFLPSGTITNSYGVYISNIDGTNTWGLYQSSSDDKNYFAGNVGIGTTNMLAKVNINNTLNVGITSGTWITNPLHAIMANGVISARSGGDISTSNSVAIQGGTGTSGEYINRVRYGGAGTNANLFEIQGVNNTMVIRTDSLGYVYRIGNSSQFNTTSDIRIKRDIKKLDSALPKILKLVPVTFRWSKDYLKANKNMRDEINYGFIAQQVQPIMPEMVSKTVFTYGEKTINDFLQLDPGILNPYLVRAIQEQQKQIDSNTNQLNSLFTDLSLTSTGDLEIKNVGNELKLTNKKDGSFITRIGAFAEIIVAKIKAGLIEAKKIVVDQLFIGETDVGKKLQELSDKIDKQQETINAQQKEIEGLKEEIKKLKNKD
jgi:uncharacterized coiled-coil protein SlyX